MTNSNIFLTFNTQFTRLQDYLKRRYDEKIVAEDVRDYTCMSESTVKRLLKKSTGRNLIEQIRYIRIQQAKSLLLTTTDKICSIGYSVGFESPSNFCRVFKTGNESYAFGI